MCVIFHEAMTSKDEFYKNETVRKPSKNFHRSKNNLMGKHFVVFPRVGRIYIMDNDAIDLSSDDEENLQGKSPNDIEDFL